MGTAGEGSGRGALLSIQDLRVYYYFEAAVTKAVDGVSLNLEKGDVLGIIGESGSGKSTLARAVPRLLSRYAKIVSGRIVFEGEDLTTKDERDMMKIRGKRVSIILQNPSALNPTIRIGEQIAEVLRDVSPKSDPKPLVVEALRMVGIHNAESRASSYPYEFSVGMRQRVMIAMALAAKPALVVADEPTSALDVSTQAQILGLIDRLKAELGFSMLFITHHIGVASQMCNKIAVMYGGKVVEVGPKDDVLSKPRHPYSFGLLRSIPYLTRDMGKLYVIEGKPPDLTDPPPGCRFHPRCRNAIEICMLREPPLDGEDQITMSACFNPIR